MKKRCTNPSCRREFRFFGETEAKCPHCGREYPRANPGCHPGSYAVVLSAPGEDYRKCIPVIRQYGRSSLYKAKILSCNIPCLAASDLPYRRAEAMVEAFLRCGAQARIVQNRTCHRLKVFRLSR